MSVASSPPTKMYILTDPCCRLTVNMLTLLASSKRNSFLHNFIVVSCTSIILSAALFFQASLFITHEFGMHLIVESVPVMATLIICLSYIFIGYFNRNKYDQLITLLISDGGKADKTADEAEIQIRFEKTASLLVTFVTVGVLVGSLTMPLSGIVPQILDLLIPLNESRPRALPFHGEHFIDEEEYFYLLLLFQYLTILTVVTIAITVENMFLITVHHACGIFSVIGYALKKSLDVDFAENQLVCDREVLKSIARCVRLHLRALRFVQLVSECGNILIIMLLIVTVIDSSLSLVQLTNIDRLDVKSVMFTFAQMAQFGLVSYIGQLLINESEILPLNIYDACWYNGSVKLKKLFILLLMRSYAPCAIVAGNMYVVSMQNYSMVVQTVISYCMVLKQFQ